MMEVVGHAVDQFDVASASTVFWEHVPVLLQRGDREDAVEELSVRLLAGHTRHNHTMKVLRMHIFNDDDLFFLHTLEVSEEDFQTLKVEQGILVDFANFSGKIIDLLKRCIASRDEETPRFRAVLGICPGESVFKMVETNDFKQLPHISLCFRPGTDMAIKSFLAFRLTEMQTDREKLQGSLATCRHDLQAANSTVATQQAALKQMDTTHTRMLMETDAVAKDAAASAMQERVRERDELVRSHERERAAAQEKHAQAIQALQDRLKELDTENRALRDQKYALDSRVSELSHKYGSSEGHVKSLQEEVDRCQKQLQTLARDKTDADVELTDARAKLTSLRDRVSMQEKVLQQQTERTQDLEASLKQLEGRCADLREASTGHEHRAKEASAEVVKGNQIIERLTSDLQVNKEKLKRKQAIIVRQEEELGSRDRAAEATAKESQDARRQLSSLQEEQARLSQTNEELRSKLEDSKQQLKGNEQMIRWLNAQVNEAQLAATRPAPSSSRYAFKPSMTTSSIDTPSLGYSRGHVPSSSVTRAQPNGPQTPVPFKPMNGQRSAVTDDAHLSGKFGGFSMHHRSGSATSPSFGQHTR